MKKICVVTGSRAEYGLLRWVLEGINKSKLLNLQLIVTGMHLLPEFGLTAYEDNRTLIGGNLYYLYKNIYNQIITIIITR